mgnify:CR=1 FL=1
MIGEQKSLHSLRVMSVHGSSIRIKTRLDRNHGKQPGQQYFRAASTHSESDEHGPLQTAHGSSLGLCFKKANQFNVAAVAKSAKASNSSGEGFMAADTAMNTAAIVERIATRKVCWDLLALPPSGNGGRFLSVAGDTSVTSPESSPSFAFSNSPWDRSPLSLSATSFSRSDTTDMSLANF